MPGGDQRFTRQNRLLTPQQFGAVFEKRTAKRGRFFHLYARQTDVTDIDPSPVARLGLVVPKKQLKTAVHRNLVKRVGREVFRAMKSRLQPRDYVLRLAIRLQPRKEPLSRAAFRAELMLLFRAFAAVDKGSAAESS